MPLVTLQLLKPQEVDIILQLKFSVLKRMFLDGDFQLLVAHRECQTEEKSALPGMGLTIPGRVG